VQHCNTLSTTQVELLRVVLGVEIFKLDTAWSVVPHSGIFGAVCNRGHV